MLAHLLLTFRHRAGVRPYTSSCDFAESCVFDKQSLPPLLCHLPMVAHQEVPLLPKLRGQFAEFLQHHSLIRLGILYLSTCVGFGYGLSCGGYFLDMVSCSINPIRSNNRSMPSPSRRRRNINRLPIDYGFRPRLRGRLTLRGLSVRRNPWTSGECVSHTLSGYSCQHSHFRYLQHFSQSTFNGLRNAPLPL